jgi:hypothetical protein
MLFLRTSEGGEEKKMKRGITILTTTYVIIMILAVAPLTSAIAPAETQKQTQRVLVKIGTQTKIQEMPLETIYEVIDIGKACKQDFLTVYNKKATPDEVEKAFEDIQPFFTALVENKMTDSTVEELNDLFQQIRDKIRAPQNPRWEYDPDGPQPAGNWNGLPTPMFGNVACGIFNVGVPAIGFTLGTHTILPTIGADILTTWADSGETISVGITGYTTSTGPEFGLIIGFIGIMIALPIMILGFIFQVGFATLYVGVSPSPI